MYTHVHTCGRDTHVHTCSRDTHVHTCGRDTHLLDIAILGEVAVHPLQKNVRHMHARMHVSPHEQTHGRTDGEPSVSPARLTESLWSASCV